MRVLQIEDDSATAQVVELMLKSEGFNVYTTDLGEEGVDLAKVYDYDCVLLDLNLPDMSGLEVLKAVRAAKVMAPVMIVTGSHEVEREVSCFAAGADDFLRKPFHKDVLISRLHAIIRRSKGHAASVIKLGRVEVNLDLKLVKVDGKPIHLTGREYQMVELLALRGGMTLTKEMFLNHLYGGLDEPEVKIIDVFICKIRKKLGAAADQLETSWGRGYRLVAEPTPKPAPVEADVERQLGPKATILAHLREKGDADFETLRRLCWRWSVATIRASVSVLMHEGRIANVGLKRSAVYRYVARETAPA